MIEEWEQAVVKPYSAAIRGIEFFLPQDVLTNDQLASEFPEWTPEAILNKTGISERRLAAPGQCASDLAEGACRRLFDAGYCMPEDLDFVLLCTQSPDYFLPTTACLIQRRLGIPQTCGALDFNLGCSGFVYGLSLAKGLIETGQAQNILLITADTYSKFIRPEDKSVRTIFGDAAAATLVSRVAEPPNAPSSIGPFVFGTDGSGADNLIVPNGGMRRDTAVEKGNTSGVPSGSGPQCLFMNGPEIFNFTLRVIPSTVHSLLDRAGMSVEDVDLFVFHQANGFILEHLRKKLSVPRHKFLVSMQYTGNTVSCTIPIALRNALREGKLTAGSTLMLVGFGVGYSWAACILRWILP